MFKSNLFQLAFGPMSTESIEAVFRYSATNSMPLALICSKNQIDYSGGYVNNWTTEEYMKHIFQMRQKYPSSNITVCRDHCGPGFNGVEDLSDVYNTLLADLYFGFDMIHFDFCNYQGSEAEKLVETIKAVEFALKYKPDLLVEIGTEENNGIPAWDLKRLDKYTDFFLKYIPVTFYVVQTASKVYDGRQIGGFDRQKVTAASKLLHSKGLLLKEHNADYITEKEILLRKGVVDALNIAPELGTIQTSILMALMNVIPGNWKVWRHACISGAKWAKWMTSKEFHEEKAWLLSGHYHFAGEEYEYVISQLEEEIDLEELIVRALIERIDCYATSFVECGTDQYRREAMGERGNSRVH